MDSVIYIYIYKEMIIIKKKQIVCWDPGIVSSTQTILNNIRCAIFFKSQYVHDENEDLEHVLLKLRLVFCEHILQVLLDCEQNVHRDRWIKLLYVKIKGIAKSKTAKIFYFRRFIKRKIFINCYYYFFFT